MRKSAAVASAFVALAALAACESTRPDVCAPLPPGGGPPVLATQDQELCEVARLRVRDAVYAAGIRDDRRVGVIHDLSRSWGDADTVAGLVERIRGDAGDEIAEAVRRACDDVRSRSRRPLPAGCGERCLVRGAAKGARIALDDVRDLLIRTSGPMFDPAGKVERGE
ncbi:MAG: hypothetical protein HMLKMBBP_03532 [Planctomycetes bacterium]|nr:hypothetical protein [Planctomycetota bacterium]